MSIIWNIETFDTLDSTQDTLKNIIRTASAPIEGLGVRALMQTNGYGRHNRRWHGEEGNIYLSFMVKPETVQNNPAQLSLVTGISLVKTIKDYISEVGLKLKWPNDVMIDHKKCAGILIESHQVNDTSCMIVGIGINIKSPPLAISSCLDEYRAEEINTDDFLSRFLELFSEDYQIWKTQGFKPFKDQFIKLTYDKKTHVSVNVGQKQITGEFIGIDDEGNLEVMCTQTEQIQKITSGEVFVM